MKQETRAAELPTELAIRVRTYTDYLSDPVFEEAVKNYKEQIIEAWVKTNPKDKEERELLWYSYQTLLSVKGNILRAFTKANNDLNFHKIQNKDTRNV